MTGVRTVADGLHELDAWANDPVPRIPWGLPFFDRPTGGGIARSETAMVLSYSSVGKTSIAMNIIRNNPGVPALFQSLEMSWRQVIARLVAMELGISTQVIETDLAGEGRYRGHIQGIVEKYRFLVCDDTPALTLKDAKASFRRATEILGTAPRIVIWDYLELIGGTGLMAKGEAVDKAAQKLRDWHREFDCAGLVLHQVGKGSESGGFKPLALDDGKYGGHHPMDYVAAAYAPRLDKSLSEFDFKRVQPELYLQLLKNRSGEARPTGVKYRQDPISMRISPWTEPQFTTGFQGSLVTGAAAS